MNEYFVYFLIGFVAGFGSGMFGIGGGSIRTPLLNLAGLPLINAYAINLFVIPFSSIVGAATHRRNLHTSIAKYVILGGTVGSVMGALLAGFISAGMLALFFFAASVFTIIGMYFKEIFKTEKEEPHGSEIAAGAFFLNLITGLRGGSGGSLFPPFLKMMGLTMREAIATSLFATIFTSLLALFVYWGRGNILWLPAACVLVGSVLGARMGGMVSLKTKPKWLKLGLSVIVLGLATLVLFKNLLK